YGIDTWKGDEHAGFYGDEVFGKVSEYNNNTYPKFSTLVRSTFDDARSYFTEKSIDFLHIDGLHTYEAVKHDFETWRSCLSENAIVLFHDINVREREFGVFRYWEELKKEHKYFEFDFGFGLGVIAIGEKYSQVLKSLFEKGKSSEYYNFLRNIFADRGDFFEKKLENRSLRNEIDRFRNTAGQLEINNSELSAQLAGERQSLQNVLHTANATAEQLSNMQGLKEKAEEDLRMVNQLFADIQSNNKNLGEELARIQEENQYSKEVNSSLQQKELYLLNLNTELRNTNLVQAELIKEKGAELQSLSNALKIGEEKLNQLQALLDIKRDEAREILIRTEFLEQEKKKLLSELSGKANEALEQSALIAELTKNVNASNQDINKLAKEKDREILTAKDEISKAKSALSEINREFEKYKTIQEKNNAELVFLLENQVNHFKKDILWYQSTYEKRTILGIVKDRVLKKIKNG
ncbi:MAG TPA: class I SAM-dependent methyltransferase, partial [Chitinophagaceae bacterium]|nr:class I SAM-dependent methyltransferase [Chitinophagaceae bacterium]